MDTQNLPCSDNEQAAITCDPSSEVLHILSFLEFIKYLITKKTLDRKKWVSIMAPLKPLFFTFPCLNPSIMNVVKYLKWVKVR